MELLAWGAVGIFAMAAALVMYLAMRFLTILVIDRFADDHDDSLQVQMNAISTLAVHDARQRAERILRVQNRFRVEPLRYPTDDRVFNEVCGSLPPLAKEFFRIYGSVSTASGEAAVGPGYFHSTERPDLICIGGTEDGAVFVETMAETVYVGFAEDDLSTDAPTIYHWVLWCDLLFNGDNVRLEGQGYGNESWNPGNS